ncbi:g8700 [Coccomyxa elongata]
MAFGPGLVAGLVLALLTCSGHSDEQLPTAELLIPKNEADYSNMLSAHMEQQLKILQETLGADHPQVSLASTLVDLQNTVGTLMANLTADSANFVKFITTAPTFFNHLAADAALLNKQIVASVAAVSPRLANANVLKLQTPIFFQNDPKIISASKTLVSVSTRLFNVGPCLITLGETGVRINPSLIGISPRLLNLGWCPTATRPPPSVPALPSSPTPDAPSIVNEWGQIVATAPTPKLTPVNSDGSPVQAAATGRRL